MEILIKIAAILGSPLLEKEKIAWMD